MKVIIVENDKNQQKKIVDIILKVSFNDENLTVERYEKFSSKLKQTIEDLSEPKIYILDIELDSDVSGIQIAKMIREIDWESFIIFETSHDKMFEKVYRNIFGVFDFIEKFDEFEKRLEKDLKKIMSQNFDYKLFKYENARGCLQIYQKDMHYIATSPVDRKIIVRTGNNTFKVNLSLNQAFALLDARFKYVHRACIVNTQKVREYHWSKSEFVLINGEVVPLLSRKYKKDIV